MHAVSGHLNLYFGNFRIRDKAEIEYILCDKGSNHSVHSAEEAWYAILKLAFMIRAEI